MLEDIRLWTLMTKRAHTSVIRPTQQEKGVLEQRRNAILLRAPLRHQRRGRQPIAILCDGHDGHLTLPLIEFCGTHHIYVLRRVQLT